MKCAMAFWKTVKQVVNQASSGEPIRPYSRQESRHARSTQLLLLSYLLILKCKAASCKAGGVKCTVHSVHSVQCTVCSAQCTVHSVYSVQCTVCTVYSAQCVQCVQCTVCTVCTVCSVQCTVCTVYSVQRVQCVKCKHFTLHKLWSLLLYTLQLLELQTLHTS
jgi:hypothetical protein